MTEKLSLPNQVIDSDWKDDIGDYETYGTPKQEMEYVSRTDVPKQSLEKLKSIDLRPKFRERGQKIAHIFTSEQLTA